MLEVESCRSEVEKHTAKRLNDLTSMFSRYDLISEDEREEHLHEVYVPAVTEIASNLDALSKEGAKYRSVKEALTSLGENGCLDSFDPRYLSSYSTSWSEKPDVESKVNQRLIDLGSALKIETTPEARFALLNSLRYLAGSDIDTFELRVNKSHAKDLMGLVDELDRDFDVITLPYSLDKERYVGTEQDNGSTLSRFTRREFEEYILGNLHAGLSKEIGDEGLPKTKDYRELKEKADEYLGKHSFSLEEFCNRINGSLSDESMEDFAKAFKQYTVDAFLFNKLFGVCRRTKEDLRVVDGQRDRFLEKVKNLYGRNVYLNFDGEGVLANVDKMEVYNDLTVIGNGDGRFRSIGEINVGRDFVGNGRRDLKHMTIDNMVKDMSQMRTEAIRDRKLSDSQKDEYLQMTHNLSLGIQAVADETMMKRMQTIAGMLTKNPSLLQYDPMQDGHWRKKESRFAESLDDLLISIVQNNFYNVEDKHHVLQAIKYLGANGSSFKEREAVYDTILPFHQPVPLETREGTLKKIFGKFFGAKHKFQSLEGLVLSVDATESGFSPELIEMARERGYTSLKVEMTDKELERIQSNSTIKSFRQVAEKDIESGRDSKTLKNMVDCIIEYTKPLSSVVLGALPQSLQYRLDDSDSLPNFDSETAFATSCLAEIGTAVAGSIGYSLYRGDGWPLLFMGVPLLADGIRRAEKGLENMPKYLRYRNCVGSTYRDSIGSVFLKPVFYPLEIYLDKKDKAPKKTITIEMPVREIKDSKQPSNLMTSYDRIARLEVPEGVEQSLVWSIENHNSFGKPFINYVSESVGKSPIETDVSTNVDRETQSVSYNHELLVDGFRKNSSLYCFNDGRRYLVTSIARDKGQKDFVESTREVLATDEDTRVKLDKIREQTDAKYVHLREYQNREIVNNLEASG